MELVTEVVLNIHCYSEFHNFLRINHQATDKSKGYNQRYRENRTVTINTNV